MITSSNYTNTTISIEVKHDAGIRGLVSMAYTHAMTRLQDTTFICLGVVDMLNTDSNTGISTLCFQAVAEMTEYITGILNEGNVNFHQDFPQSHIVFGLMTDLDLKRYPMTNDDDSYHQYIIDASIARIDDQITAINEKNTSTPPGYREKFIE